MKKNDFEELTYKQLKFFNKLKEFMKEEGYVPTIRELGEYVGLNSPATIKTYLDILEKKGYIKRINNRAIEILFEGDYIWNLKKTY